MPPGDMEIWSLNRVVVQTRIVHATTDVPKELISSSGNKYSSVYEVQIKKFENNLRQPPKSVAIDAPRFGWEEMIGAQLEFGLNMGGNALAEIRHSHKRLKEMDFSDVISAMSKLIANYGVPRGKSPEQAPVYMQEFMRVAVDSIDTQRMAILEAAGINIKQLAKPETIMSTIVLECYTLISGQSAAIRDTIPPKLLDDAKNMCVTPSDFSNFKMALEATSFDPATAFPADDEDHASFFSGNFGKHTGQSKRQAKGQAKGQGSGQLLRGRTLGGGSGGSRPRSQSRLQGELTGPEYYAKGVEYIGADFGNVQRFAELVCAFFTDQGKPEPFVRDKKNIFVIPLRLTQGYAWRMPEGVPPGAAKPLNHDLRIDMYGAWSLLRDLKAGGKYLSKVGRSYRDALNPNWTKLTAGQFSANYKPATGPSIAPFPNTMTSVLGEQKAMFKFN